MKNKFEVRVSLAKLLMAGVALGTIGSCGSKSKPKPDEKEQLQSGSSKSSSLTSRSVPADLNKVKQPENGSEEKVLETYDDIDEDVQNFVGQAFSDILAFKWTDINGVNPSALFLCHFLDFVRNNPSCDTASSYGIGIGDGENKLHKKNLEEIFVARSASKDYKDSDVRLNIGYEFLKYIEGVAKVIPFKVGGLASGKTLSAVSDSKAMSFPKDPKGVGNLVSDVKDKVISAKVLHRFAEELEYMGQLFSPLFQGEKITYAKIMDCRKKGLHKLNDKGEAWGLTRSEDGDCVKDRGDSSLFCDSALFYRRDVMSGSDMSAKWEALGSEVNFLTALHSHHLTGKAGCDPKDTIMARWGKKNLGRKAEDTVLVYPIPHSMVKADVGGTRRPTSLGTVSSSASKYLEKAYSMDKTSKLSAGIGKVKKELNIPFTSDNSCFCLFPEIEVVKGMHWMRDDLSPSSDSIQPSKDHIVPPFVGLADSLIIRFKDDNHWGSWAKGTIFEGETRDNMKNMFSKEGFKDVNTKWKVKYGISSNAPSTMLSGGGTDYMAAYKLHNLTYAQMMKMLFVKVRGRPDSPAFHVEALGNSKTLPWMTFSLGLNDVKPALDVTGEASDPDAVHDGSSIVAGEAPSVKQVRFSMPNMMKWFEAAEKASLDDFANLIGSLVENDETLKKIFPIYNHRLLKESLPLQKILGHTVGGASMFRSSDGNRLLANLKDLLASDGASGNDKSPMERLLATKVFMGLVTHFDEEDFPVSGGTLDSNGDTIKDLAKLSGCAWQFAEAKRDASEKLESKSSGKTTGEFAHRIDVLLKEVEDQCIVSKNEDGKFCSTKVTFLIAAMVKEFKDALALKIECSKSTLLEICHNSSSKRRGLWSAEPGQVLDLELAYNSLMDIAEVSYDLFELPQALVDFANSQKTGCRELEAGKFLSKYPVLMERIDQRKKDWLANRAKNKLDQGAVSSEKPENQKKATS